MVEMADDWVVVASTVASLALARRALESASSRALCWIRLIASWRRFLSMATWVRISPISSRLSTVTRFAKSPAATRFVPTVSARMGVIRICDSRNDKITQITRPSASATT